MTQKIVQDFVKRAARRAQLPKAGVHRLRHSKGEIPLTY